MDYPETKIPLRIAELMVGFFRDTLTMAEYKELTLWLNNGRENMQNFDKIAEIAFRENFKYILEEPEAIRSNNNTTI